MMRLLDLMQNPHYGANTTGATPLSEIDVAHSLIRSLENIGKIILETQSFWADPMGVSVPQWLILAAIAELDAGNGIPVTDVARRIRVDPSFVTAQTKMLEREGHVTRKPSSEDGRVVLMSLTDRASTGLAEIESKKAALNKFIFSDFKHRDLQALSSALLTLEKRFAKAPLMLALDA